MELKSGKERFLVTLITGPVGFLLFLLDDDDDDDSTSDDCSVRIMIMIMIRIGKKKLEQPM